MSTEEHEPNQHKRMGSGMIIAMWVLFFLLLMYMFQGILDRQHNPNQNINTLTQFDGTKEVVLQRNKYGHYVSRGKINGTEVTFMLDTGASDVSIPIEIAEKIGLKAGRKMYYQTANGKAAVYATQLDRIAIGDIELQNVRATINPNVDDIDILLGMTFLKHLEFSQYGDTLTIRQHPQ